MRLHEMESVEHCRRLLKRLEQIERRTKEACVKAAIKWLREEMEITTEGGFTLEAVTTTRHSIGEAIRDCKVGD